MRQDRNKKRLLCRQAVAVLYAPFLLGASGDTLSRSAANPHRTLVTLGGLSLKD